MSAHRRIYVSKLIFYFQEPTPLPPPIHFNNKLNGAKNCQGNCCSCTRALERSSAHANKTYFLFDLSEPRARIIYARSTILTVFYFRVDLRHCCGKHIYLGTRTEAHTNILSSCPRLPNEPINWNYTSQATHASIPGCSIRSGPIDSTRARSDLECENPARVREYKRDARHNKMRPHTTHVYVFYTRDNIANNRSGGACY